MYSKLKRKYTNVPKKQVHSRNLGQESRVTLAWTRVTLQCLCVKWYLNYLFVICRSHFWGPKSIFHRSKSPLVSGHATTDPFADIDVEKAIVFFDKSCWCISYRVMLASFSFFSPYHTTLPRPRWCRLFLRPWLVLNTGVNGLNRWGGWVRHHHLVALRLLPQILWAHVVVSKGTWRVMVTQPVLAHQPLHQRLRKWLRKSPRILSMSGLMLPRLPSSCLHLLVKMKLMEVQGWPK